MGIECIVQIRNWEARPNKEERVINAPSNAPYFNPPTKVEIFAHRMKIKLNKAAHTKQLANIKLILN